MQTKASMPLSSGGSWGGQGANPQTHDRHSEEQLWELLSSWLSVSTLAVIKFVAYSTLGKIMPSALFYRKSSAFDWATVSLLHGGLDLDVLQCIVGLHFATPKWKKKFRQFYSCACLRCSTSRHCSRFWIRHAVSSSFYHNMNVTINIHNTLRFGYSFRFRISEFYKKDMLTQSKRATALLVENGFWHAICIHGHSRSFYGRTFLRYSDLLAENCVFFLPLSHLAPQCSLWNFAVKLTRRKLL